MELSAYLVGGCSHMIWDFFSLTKGLFCKSYDIRVCKICLVNMIDGNANILFCTEAYMDFKLVVSLSRFIFVKQRPSS